MANVITERAYQNVDEAYSILAEHLGIFEIAEVLGLKNSWQLHAALISHQIGIGFSEENKDKKLTEVYGDKNADFQRLKPHARPEVGNAISQISLLTTDLEVMKSKSESKANLVKAWADWDNYIADHEDLDAELDAALKKEEQIDDIWKEKSDSIQLRNIVMKKLSQSSAHGIDLEAVFNGMPNRPIQVDVEFRYHHRNEYDIDHTKATYSVTTDNSSSAKVEGIKVYFRNYNQPFQVILTANDLTTGEKISGIISSEQITGWSEVPPVVRKEKVKPTNAKVAQEVSAETGD